MKCEIEVFSDLYVAGRHPEEGTDIIGEVFYVVATEPDGRRYRHERSFPNLHWVKDDELEFGGYYGRLEGELAASKLSETVRRAGGPINLNSWREIDPAYGSEQYQRQGIEQERAWQDRFDD
jgi:hypothetical protein